MKYYLIALFIVIAFTGCDPCRNKDCKNSVSCSDNTCNCMFGYEGELCETLIRDKMLGTYRGVNICADIPDDSSFGYIISVHPDERKKHYVSVQEIGQQGQTFCEVTGTNTFSFVNNHAGYYLEYTGTVDGDNIEIIHKSGNPDYSVNDCVFKGTRVK